MTPTPPPTPTPKPAPASPSRRRQTTSASVARSRWGQFAQRYGWRAYALCIVAALTLGVLIVSLAPGHPRHLASPQIPAGVTQKPSPTGPVRAGAAARPLQRTSSRARSSGVKAHVPTSTDGPASTARSTPAPVVLPLGDDALACAAKSARQLVLVSISRQHLWACSAGKLVNSTAVTTGAATDDHRTPLGSWRVQAKQRNRYLRGPGYKQYVQYWMPFDGSFGLHDASWQKMPFGSQQWRTQGSRGCVHLPTTKMAWLYRWVSVGDTVVTIKK